MFVLSLHKLDTVMLGFGLGPVEGNSPGVAVNSRGNKNEKKQKDFAVSQPLRFEKAELRRLRWQLM